MNWKLATGIAVALVALGAAMLAFLQPHSDATPTSAENSESRATRTDPPDLANLRRLAEEACLCEQASGQADCGAAYREAISGYQVETAGTACAPISSYVDHIIVEGQTYFVTTEYNVVANLPPWMSTKLCKEADAQAVEAAYSRALRSASGERSPPDEATLMAAHEAANRALVRTMQDIRRGKKMTPISNHRGCA